jgi:hypothetical protein
VKVSDLFGENPNNGRLSEPVMISSHSKQPGRPLLLVVAVTQLAILAGTASGNLIGNADFANVVIDHPTDVVGPGVSDGSTNYFVDGWTSGARTIGPWPGSGGVATIDTQSPGGNPLGSTLLAPGIAPSTVDGNGTFLGMFRATSNAEYATRSIGTIPAGEYSFSYYGAVGGSSDSTGNGSGQTLFFIDTDNNFANGGRVYEHLSTIEPFLGPGNQTWQQVSGTVSLAAGTYFVGFAPNLENSYTVVDGAYFAAIPEPASCYFLGLSLLGIVGCRKRSQ